MPTSQIDPNDADPDATSFEGGSNVAQVTGAQKLNDKATIIRCPVKNIRVAGRNTQGVTILNTSKGEKVISVVRVPEGSEEEEAEETVEENNNDQ